MSTLFEVDALPEERPLPPIQGTPAQYEWATKVRDGKIRDCRKHIRDWQCYIARLEDAGREDTAEREREALGFGIERLEVLEQEARARFWLDARELTARELLSGAPPRPGPSFNRGE